MLRPTVTTTFQIEEEVDEMVSLFNFGLLNFILIFFSQFLQQITCQYQVCTLQTEYNQ